MPRPLVLFDCGSRSITRTWAPRSASAAPRFMTVVVFPTPPFWFATAMIRGVDISTFALTCGNSTTWRDMARLPILWGGFQVAQPAGEKSGAGAGGHEHHPGDRRRSEQHAADSHSHKSVVHDMAHGARRRVRDPPDEAQADGQDEHCDGVQRQAVLRVDGREDDGGPQDAQPGLHRSAEERLLADPGREGDRGDAQRVGELT